MARARSRELYLAVDLGATKLFVAVADGQGNILWREGERTRRTPSSFRTQLTRLATRARDTAVSLGGKLVACGIGSPGPLDTRRGIILRTPNLPLRNFDLRSCIEKPLHIPTVVNNDVNVGTLGEAWRGAGAGLGSVVGIFPGTGIGGGIILDGRIWDGASMNAGEIGHMIVEIDGPRCGCGGHGCVEAFASRTGIAREIAERLAGGAKSAITRFWPGDIRDVPSSALAWALAYGDGMVCDVIKHALRALTIGCINIIHVLGPDVIVFGGGLVEALGGLMLKTLRRDVYPLCMVGTADRTEIRRSLLGDEAALVGCVALALQSRGKPLPRLGAISPRGPKYPRVKVVRGKVSVDGEQVRQSLAVASDGHLTAFPPARAKVVPRTWLDAAARGDPQSMIIGTDRRLSPESRAFLEIKGAEYRVLRPAAAPLEFQKQKGRKALLLALDA